jgi:hypothetical protein
MKKSIVGILAVAALAAYLVGCASGGVPAKKSSDDCLVLIRTKVINKTGEPMARKYFFFLSSGYPKMKAPSNADGFMVAAIREPGVKIVRVETSVNTDEGAFGASASYPVDILLPYKPGEVLSADFCFTTELTKAGPGKGNLVSSKFEKLTEADKAVLAEDFWNTEGSSSWRKQ